MIKIRMNENLEQEFLGNEAYKVTYKAPYDVEVDEDGVDSLEPKEFEYVANSKEEADEFKDRAKEYGWKNIKVKKDELEYKTESFVESDDLMDFYDEDHFDDDEELKDELNEDYDFDYDSYDSEASDLENLEDTLTGDFHRDVEDFVEDIEDYGGEVLDSDEEGIDFVYNGVEYYATLNCTYRGDRTSTVWVTNVKEIGEY